MSDLKFYLSRFFRRFPYFLIVATLISAVAVTVAMTLPPAYESSVRMIVESQQIPDSLAQSTVATPAAEQLQLIEQRLLTRTNLLDIANVIEAVRDQDDLTPDEIVEAMRAHTRVRSQAGRNQAAVMSITYEAPTATAAAAVVNAYLTRILEQDVQYRTGRAENTLEFFEQQVQQLGQDLDSKSAEILAFKNENTDALPETLGFRMTERSRLVDNLQDVESEIETLRRQREQLVRVAQATLGRGNQGASSDPRRQRLQELETALQQLLSVYSEESIRVKRVRAEIAQIQASIRADLEALLGTDGQDQAGDDAAEPRVMTPEQELVEANPMLGIQLSDFDDRIASLQDRQADLAPRIAELDASIERTPTNAVVLSALERDYENLQNQYNNAVTRLAQASTGERIELLSRGQRITVVEPPVVPFEPTKPNRVMLAGAGSLAGILAGFGLVVLIEILQQTPRRAEDIVARFDVMPIATVPYIRSRRQIITDRSIRILIALLILIGIPAAIFAVHQYYMPLDLVADKVMNRLGVRW